MARECHVRGGGEGKSTGEGKTGEDARPPLSMEILLCWLRFSRWLLEQPGINRGIELDAGELDDTRIFSVLFILVEGGQRDSVGGFPVAQVGLSLNRSGAAHGLVGFPHDVAGFGIDEPANRHIARAHVNDSSLDITNLLVS